MPAGFLYVLINPTMPGLAKVGKTTRNPTDRVAELSSATGVPSPFMLAFQQPVAECDFAELWVHRELEREGFRHAENREFFNAPLHAIIKVVAQASNLVFDSSNAIYSDERASEDESNAETLALELFNLGVPYEEGSDTVLKNPRKALKYFEQAVALGHQHACFKAAVIYQYGADGVPKDLEKALVFYNKLVCLGNWQAEACIAEIFLEAKQVSAAQAHWIRFFECACEEMEFQPNNEYTELYIGLSGSKYCEIVAAGELAHCIPDQTIVSLGDPILAGIKNKEEEVALYSDKNLSLIMEDRLRSASMLIMSLKNYGSLVSNGYWFYEANIANAFMEAGQKAAAEVHWKKFFDYACEAIESGANESLDEINGDFGYQYCVAVANGELAHCVPDETIARFAERLLQAINSEILDVNQMPEKELRAYMKERFVKALHFVREKAPVIDKNISNNRSHSPDPKWSLWNLFKQ